MADTFFGFDTSAPFDNDGGSGLDELDDYDALNEETFGSAIKDDWEGDHENLVLLDRNGNTSSKEKDETDDGDLGDLDFSIARMGLEDCEEGLEDCEGRVQLDPSVWSSRDRHDDPFNHKQFNGMVPPENFMPHLLTMPNQMNIAGPSVGHPFQQQMANQAHQHMLNASRQPNMPPKIMSVEDLERNQIRNQQMQQKSEPTMKPPTPQNLQQRPNVQQNFPPSLGQLPKGQPMFMPHSNVPNDLQKNSNQQMPMGFPVNMMTPHMNAQTSQMHPNLARVPPNVPMPMNNFNVNSMRTATPPTPIMQMHPKQMQQSQSLNQPAGMQPQAPGQQASQHKRMAIIMPPHMQMPQFQSAQQQQSASVNQFNKRLVHEIQQNHPMLFNAKNNTKGNNSFPFGMKGGQPTGPLSGGMNHHHPNMQYHHQQQQQHQNQHRNINNNNNSHQNRLMNGTLEYDEYANLMSQRDKQWLIGIQLSQLNTGTPYIDDFYYTVFRERKAKLKGIKENKAHKDNQLNHPLIQPKGHAQLVLISMGNKNGTNQQRNQRERKNSESSKEKETPRTYTPLQFENSLGKLQCGSVTAPRKIIDMDIVGADTGSPLNSTNEISTQRKSRQILLHIETLYRVALKLEDLEDPTAIATALIVKERKEKERLLAAEQERLNEANDSKTGSDFVSNVSRSSSSLSADKDDTREELLEKLFAGLTQDKVAQMMIIRKGKTLIKRILALIKDNVYRWDVWIAILIALPLLVKKDRDDAESPLFMFFPEFQSYIENASIDSILRLTNAIMSCEKLSYIFTNKFSISCVIVLLVKMESVYAISSNAISPTQQASWLEFLTALVDAVDKLGNMQLVNVAYENDVLKPLLNHFSRFRDLKSQPLIEILTQKNS